jgi:hypothetical protein
MEATREGKIGWADATATRYPEVPSEPADRSHHVNVRAQALAEVERASDQTAAAMNGSRPAQLAGPLT